MIVWLASYPRSGNTFFRALLAQCAGYETHTVYDNRDLPDLTHGLLGQPEHPASLQDLGASPDVHFVKTHEYPVDAAPAIYLVRDGRDAVVSYAHFSVAFSGRRNPAWRLATKLFPSALFRIALWWRIHMDRLNWGAHVRKWTGRPAPAKTVVIRYRDLIQDPIAQLQQAFAALDLPVKLGDRPIPTFEELHARWPAFFRRGQVGAHRDEMPKRMLAAFEAQNADELRRFGYL